MFWTTAFLDLPDAGFEDGLRFWEGVTGYERSAPRGPDGEFATLVPARGDAHLKLQRRREGPGRLHLDLHVDDIAAAADDAERLGAGVVTRSDLGYVVMASPGGFPFCFVTHPASGPATPATWHGDLRTVVDQVCLDIPGPAYEEECAFWERLTGWELRVSAEHDEFRRLIRPPDLPLQLLLQRLGEDDGPVRAHLDLATTDRAAETARHVGLGADLVEVFGGWTVLTDPAGTTYCITGRTPETRVLDEPPPTSVRG
ncbi:MAG: hypothetical protein JWN22_1237 [Nocardioides sp.]|nr:hypothetical protein [Nocardioides sp.]